MQAVAHITVEPWGGLKAVTQQAATDLANLLHTYELQGLTVIIRFGQEMNGRLVNPAAHTVISFIHTYRHVGQYPERAPVIEKQYVCYPACIDMLTCIACVALSATGKRRIFTEQLMAYCSIFP